MGEGAQQSYLSWQGTQRRYECSAKKRKRRGDSYHPNGEQVPIYSTNKQDIHVSQSSFPNDKCM